MDLFNEYWLNNFYVLDPKMAIVDRTESAQWLKLACWQNQNCIMFNYI